MEQEAAFEDQISAVQNAPEYLRSIWRTVRSMGLTADDALISIALGSDPSAPDYVVREVMEGTAADPQGVVNHGAFSGRTHRGSRKLKLPSKETDCITLPKLIALLGSATGRKSR